MSDLVVGKTISSTKNKCGLDIILIPYFSLTKWFVRKSLHLFIYSKFILFLVNKKTFKIMLLREHGKLRRKNSKGKR